MNAPQKTTGKIAMDMSVTINSLKFRIPQKRYPPMRQHTTPFSDTH
jgi:hypothetical protein